MRSQRPWGHPTHLSACRAAIIVMQGPFQQEFNQILPAHAETLQVFCGGVFFLTLVKQATHEELEEASHGQLKVAGGHRLQESMHFVSPRTPTRDLPRFRLTCEHAYCGNTMPSPTVTYYFHSGSHMSHPSHPFLLLIQL